MSLITPSPILGIEKTLYSTLMLYHYSLQLHKPGKTTAPKYSGITDEKGLVCEGIQLPWFLRRRLSRENHQPLLSISQLSCLLTEEAALHI